MKNLLLILIASIALMSCGSPTVEKTDSLPVEVITIKEAQKFDTLLVIPTTNETYVFDKQGEYKGRYANTTDNQVLSGVMGTIFILLLIILCILLIISLVNI